MLLNKTKSICPVCKKTINAQLYDKNNRVWIHKKCSKHGVFNDVYWDNTDSFLNYMKYIRNGNICSKYIKKNKNKKCPHNCGLCSEHKSRTAMGIVELTNRCNLKCPICLADSGSGKYVYEPDTKQVKKIIANLKKYTNWIQFSGGEPTVREDLPELIGFANKIGFDKIQLATNGIKMAQSLEYCKLLVEKGLNIVYFSFDGVTKEPYIKLRGYNMLPTKIKAVENMREAGIKFVFLASTIIRGINDNEIWDIVKFAIKNRDVVKAVLYQPICFNGRMSKSELEKRRITGSDIFRLIEKQTNGKVKENDFYPLSSTTIPDFFANTGRKIGFETTCHPCCGGYTYIYIDNGKIIPVPRFIDFEGLSSFFSKQLEDIKKGKNKLLIYLNLLKIKKFLKKEKMPTTLKRTLFLKLILRGILPQVTVEDWEKLIRGTIYIGTMSFMDPYNVDLERLKRCILHVGTPDNEIIPYCAYNIIYREKIEKKFSKLVKINKPNNSIFDVGKQKNI